jgi:hypothetical protein
MRVDGVTVTIGAVVGFLLGYWAVKHFRTTGSLV